MKIQILSDIHSEFDAGDYSFLMSLNPKDIDVLILAGDICMMHNAKEVMKLLSELYKDSIILWIHGNHEYYRSNPKIVQYFSSEIERTFKNIKWLDNSIFELEGRRFLGTTLWFREQSDNKIHSTLMNDFYLIGDFENWVYQKNKESIEFIERETREGDIIITHHLPSYKSVHQKYVGSNLNRFFVCDMENSIKRLEPALWIHGHTHHPFDYMINSTRIICNPKGYYQERKWNGDGEVGQGTIIELI